MISWEVSTSLVIRVPIHASISIEIIFDEKKYEKEKNDQNLIKRNQRAVLLIKMSSTINRNMTACFMGATDMNELKMRWTEVVNLL